MNDANKPTPVARVEQALREHGSRPDGNGSSDWTCPAHDDREPSLAVGQGDDGRVLLHCHAGCTTESVARALGLELRDLFPPTNGKARTPSRSKRRELARYTYTDENGVELFDVVRAEPKDFHQERVEPDGRRVGGRGCMRGVRLVPYKLPEVVAAVAAGDTVYVVEGEKDVEALRAVGCGATCNPGGAGKWKPEYAGFLKGAGVVVVADCDEPGRRHARDVARSLQGVAASVRLVEAREGKDAHDHLAAGHTLEALVDVEEKPTGRCDRAQDADADPAAVATLAGLLEQTTTLVRYYVVLGRHEAVAVSLWILHTHLFGQFDTTPYLHITSPEKRAGKTRLLDVLALLVARAWRLVTPSEAVVFRKIEADGPTVLLDEVDAIYGPRAREHEGLRALLNAGHSKGARVSRCVGEGARQRVVDFAVFCPKALAGIGTLPDTVRDRSITIGLRRRMRSEPVAKFRRRQAEAEAKPIRERFEGLALSVNLSEARPAVPDALNDRAADGWEPLLAIADLAGGEWPRRARDAALSLHAAEDGEDGSLGVRLLGDLRQVFVERANPPVLRTEVMLEALHAMAESPWAALGKEGRPLRAHGLARLLKPYSVRPKVVRVGAQTPRGYSRDDLLDPWARYLDPLPSSAQKGPETQQHNMEDGADPEGDECCAVAHQTPSGRDRGEDEPEPWEGQPASEPHPDPDDRWHEAPVPWIEIKEPESMPRCGVCRAVLDGAEGILVTGGQAYHQTCARGRGLGAGESVTASVAGEDEEMTGRP